MIDSFAPVNPALIDVRLPQHDGYPEELAAGDTPDVLAACCGETLRGFPSALWVESSNWADKARENDKYKTWPINYCDRFTNQSPTDECVSHSNTRAFEIARNRAIGVIYADGPKKDYRYAESGRFGTVWLSALSSYAEANPGERGGTSLSRVLSIITRRGLLPDKIQPRDYGFRHAIQGTVGKGGVNQSRGPWLPLSQFPEGWQETAKHFRPLEIILPDSAEQIMSLVLNGYCVCVGRNGHAIPYALANVAERLIGYVDSYDVVRWDSWGTVRSAVGGSYCIATVTAPDDWDKPAG